MAADKLCLCTLIPCYTKRNRLDLVHIQADFLKPYLAREALAAKKKEKHNSSTTSWMKGFCSASCLNRTHAQDV